MLWHVCPGDEFPKSVNLDDPSVTLVPADVLL
jgi:DNA polymerase-3 subunit beta